MHAPLLPADFSVTRVALSGDLPVSLDANATKTSLSLLKILCILGLGRFQPSIAT
jgi:hypothetical protein